MSLMISFEMNIVSFLTLANIRDMVTELWDFSLYEYGL